MELLRPPFQPIVREDEVWVPFTQYLRPAGTPRKVGVTVPIAFKEKVDFILQWDSKFECEVLQTGEVSLTVEAEMPQTAGDYETVAHEICSNNQEIDAALVRLIDRAYEEVKKLYHA